MNDAIGIIKLIKKRTTSNAISALADQLLKILKSEKYEDFYVENIIVEARKKNYQNIPLRECWILPVFFKYDFIYWEKYFPASKIPSFLLQTFLDNLYTVVYSNVREQRKVSKYLDLLEARYYVITQKIYKNRTLNEVAKILGGER